MPKKLKDATVTLVSRSLQVGVGEMQAVSARTCSGAREGEAVIHSGNDTGA